MATPPRRLQAGTTHHITRSTFEGKCLLRPDGFLEEAWNYLIALFSARYGIEVHSFAVLSNHYHMVLTDYRGTLGHFMRDLNSAMARVINVTRGRKGPVWDLEGYHNRELHGPESVWTRLVYGISNPVKHGLVAAPERWPGAITLPAQVATTRTIRRPEFFSRSTLPDEVELTLTVPPLLKPLAPDTFRAALAKRVKARVEDLKEGRQGRPFLGRKRVMNSDPESPPPPKRYDADGARESGRCSTIGADTPEHEDELLEALTQWHEDYAWAREQWPEDKTVVFPDGTFGLRVFHGALTSKP